MDNGTTGESMSSPHSYRAVIAEMLKVYGIPFTDDNSRELAIESWEQQFRLCDGPDDSHWQLVPREATAEMVQAAEDRQVEGASYIAQNSIQFALWREVWRAMLDAAPTQPPATTGEVKG